MDITANELEDIKIINYPTLILYKKETNEVQTFCFRSVYNYFTCVYFNNFYF